MPEYDATEAPLKTVVDDPDDFSGNMGDRPVKVKVDGGSEQVFSHQKVSGLQVSMSPAEASHFADDLQAAADDCWGAAEYVVNAVRPDGEEMVYLTTIKAPAPDVAVRWALYRLGTIANSDDHHAELPGNDELAEKKLAVANDSDAFRVYRADSITTVRYDD